jgi:hypothetical protein
VEDEPRRDLAAILSSELRISRVRDAVSVSFSGGLKLI